MRIKIFIGLFILFICCLVVIIFLWNNKSNITPLSNYDPFINNEQLDKNDINISNDLPKIDAASAFYPLASSMVESIYDKNSYNHELKYVSTNDAFKDVLDKKVDISIVTKPSKNQQKMIEDSNLDIEFVPFAKEALVFYTWKKNIISSITMSEINKIYTNEITNWEELKGNNQIIKTFQLEKDNGSQTSFETYVSNSVLDNKNHFEIDDMGKIIEKAAWSKGSIGYAFNSFYTKVYNSPRLKLLSINQIEPTIKNIINNNYPLMFDVYLVYDNNNSNNNINVVSNWLLSNQGQEFVKQMGLQPIK